MFRLINFVKNHLANLKMKKITSENPNCTLCKNTHSIISCLHLPEKAAINNEKNDYIYKKGEVIFKEGNYAHNIYCVHSGKLKLSKLGKDGKEQIVRFAKAGDILGYRSLLSDDPYHANAIVMEDAEICVIPKATFQKIMEENYKLSLNMIQLLSRDLKSAEQHLIDVAQKSVRERIAESLVLLTNLFGYKEDRKTIDLIITRSEIADLAGTTTETTIRTLSQFSNENIIQLEGKKIIVNNLNQLMFIANIYD